MINKMRTQQWQNMSINLFNPDDYSEDEEILMEVITTRGSGLYHNKNMQRLEAWHVKDNKPELVGLVFSTETAQEMLDDMEHFWQMGLRPDVTWLH